MPSPSRQSSYRAGRGEPYRRGLAAAGRDALTPRLICVAAPAADAPPAITPASPTVARRPRFFDEHDIRVDRVLTDRGTEYCGAHDRHEYELYLALENIDHTRTKAKSPQTNGICERFHKTLLEEFYRVAFRKRLYDSIEALQTDLDAWLAEYNEVRTHQGRWCFGKTPMQTFLDSAALAREKQQPGLAA